MESLDDINKNAQKQSDIIEKLNTIDENMDSASEEFIQFLSSHTDKITALNALSKNIKASVDEDE